MIRLLTLAFLTMPSLANAQCNADGIESLMAPADLVHLRDVAAATPYGQGLYWSAQKNGVELAIMGTMHLADPRHDDLVRRATPQLERADVLLVEATLEDQAAMQVYMAQNPDIMTITDGPTLPDRLDPDTWALIRDAATSRGVPGFMAAKMQPWFLSMTLAIPPCAMASMMAGDLGLDGLLMKDAAALNLPVMALEPWQDMLALLSSGTFDKQIDALHISLVDPDIQDAFISTLISSYFNEDTSYGWYINSHLIDHMPNVDPALFDAQLAELEEDLLNERNRNWIPVIEAAAASHNQIFIAFGAAHLFGDQGVLNLLADNDWTITRH
ncbi:putative GumN family protein [Octadecabacter antarcticus 307]|uniref:Putative GumN family protein n=1 Tax=Octadecabacter antarcticus 307 TaxID=391626 RepID=M9R2W4_9RHOB|nr:TraB/GumN family protein [Octadecabacter antarcticus]AGI66572.1 putative GumN family protein [Octadecabacter antarcticus 307]